MPQGNVIVCQLVAVFTAFSWLALCSTNGEISNSQKKWAALQCPEGAELCRCYTNHKMKNVINCNNVPEVPQIRHSRNTTYHIYVHELDLRNNKLWDQRSDAGLLVNQESSIRILRFDFNEMIIYYHPTGLPNPTNLTAVTITNNDLQCYYNNLHAFNTTMLFDVSNQKRRVLDARCLNSLNAFKRLRTFITTGNRFPGGLKTHLPKLTQIQSLQADNCSIEKLPIFRETRKLKSLNVGQNPFTEMHHEHFTKLPLEELIMYNNRLTKVDNETFCIPTLRTLDLRQSSLSWQHIFDVCILTNVSSSLDKLYLENVYINCDCRFFTLRTQWQNRNTTLGKSPICANSSTLPEFRRRYAYNITDMEFQSKCPQPKHCVDACGTKPQFALPCPVKPNREAYACDCYITELQRPTLNCSRLKSPMAMASSNVSWISYIHYSQSAEYLNANFLAGLKKTITIIDLKGSFISLRSTYLHTNQPNLEHLSMSQTRYSPSYPLISSGHYLKKLKLIDLSQNSLEDCNENALQGAPNLETLDLSQSRTTSVGYNCFTFVRNLPITNYNHNSNRFVNGVTNDMLTAMRNLTVLRMASTNTKMLPDFGICEELQSLELGGRDLNSLFMQSFQRSYKLTELYVTDGYLTHIDLKTFCVAPLWKISVQNRHQGLNLNPCLFSALNSTLNEIAVAKVSIWCNCEFYTLRSDWKRKGVEVSGSLTCGDGSLPGFMGRNAMNVSDEEFNAQCHRETYCYDPCLPKRTPKGSTPLPCPTDTQFNTKVDCACYHVVAPNRNVIDCSGEVRVWPLKSVTSWNEYKHNFGKLKQGFPHYTFRELPNTLAVLDLRNNQLQHILPVAEKHRLTITKLLLDDNEFSTIMNIQLVWNALKFISLARNNLFYCGFDFMPNLESVNFQGQRHRPISTSCLATLKNITHINLSNNRITGGQAAFAEQMKSMTKLKHLQLQDVSWTSIPRVIFYRNPSIQVLDLSNNPISHFQKYQFVNTPKLQNLSMSSVNSSLIKSDTFCKTKLNILNLSQVGSPTQNYVEICALDPIKNTLKQLNLENTTITCNCRFLGLRRIWQRRNVMRGQSPVCGPDSLSSLRNRPAMEIPDGEYSRLCPTVQPCPKICMERPKDIKLTRPCPVITQTHTCHCYDLNEISTLDCSRELQPVMFQTAEKWLKYKQQDSSLSAFNFDICKNIPSLQQLDLARNPQMSRLGRDIRIANCTHLQTLNVSDTSMNMVWNDFEHPKLEVIDLRRTKMTEDRLAKILTKTPNLKYLDISESKENVNVVPPLIYCRKLTTYKLESLNIRLLTERAFNTFNQIKHISLARNTKLNVLSTSFCGVGHTLETLNLDGTNARIDMCSFSRFQKLQNLYLNSTITDCYCRFFEARSLLGRYINASRPAVVCENPEEVRGRYAFRIPESAVRASGKCKPGTFQSCADVCRVDTPPPPTTVIPTLTPPKSNVAIGPIIGLVVGLVLAMVLGFGVAAIVLRRSNRKPPPPTESATELPPAYAYPGGVEHVNTAIFNDSLAPPVMTSHGNMYQPVGVMETGFNEAEGAEMEKKLPPEYAEEAPIRNTRSNMPVPVAPAYE